MKEKSWIKNPNKIPVTKFKIPKGKKCTHEKDFVCPFLIPTPMHLRKENNKVFCNMWGVHITKDLLKYEKCLNKTNAYIRPFA